MLYVYFFYMNNMIVMESYTQWVIMFITSTYYGYKVVFPYRLFYTYLILVYCVYLQ